MVLTAKRLPRGVSFTSGRRCGGRGVPSGSATSALRWLTGSSDPIWWGWRVVLWEIPYAVVWMLIWVVPPGRAVSRWSL